MMKITKQTAELILSWIIGEIGYKKVRPKIKWSKLKDPPVFGQQFENQIIIYELAHKERFEEFVDTVLHEFRHIMQMNSKIYYPRLNKTTTPEQSNLSSKEIERDAELFANKYKKKFLKIIE